MQNNTKYLNSFDNTWLQLNFGLQFNLTFAWYTQDLA